MAKNAEFEVLEEGAEIWVYGYNDKYEKATYKRKDCHNWYTVTFDGRERDFHCERIVVGKLPKALHELVTRRNWDFMYFFGDYFFYHDTLSEGYPTEFELLPVADSDDMVSIYMNAKDKEKGKRTEIKIGKALRKMYPLAPDSAIAGAVVKWKQANTKQELTFHKDKESFAPVYSKDNMQESVLRYHNDFKPLSTSCMRGTSFYDGPTHPTEIFNSGDFWIYWVEDEDGNLGARCVVHENAGGELHAGPIYIATEQAKDLIAGHLVKDEVIRFEHSRNSWEGAKTLALPGPDPHTWLSPYLDHGMRGEKDGEYFILSNRGGDVDMTPTGGYVYLRVMECRDCGADGHGSGWQEVNDEYVCPDCASDYPVCEFYSTIVASESDLRKVKVGEDSFEMWGPSAIRHTRKHEGVLYSGAYFRSIWRTSESGELFPAGDHFVYFSSSLSCDTSCGWYHNSEVKPDWVCGDDGFYYPKERRTPEGERYVFHTHNYDFERGVWRSE